MKLFAFFSLLALIACGESPSSANEAGASSENTTEVSSPNSSSLSSETNSPTSSSPINNSGVVASSTVEGNLSSTNGSSTLTSSPENGSSTLTSSALDGSSTLTSSTVSSSTESLSSAVNPSSASVDSSIYTGGMKLIPKGTFYRARVENPDSSYSWSEAQEGFYTTIPNDFWLDSTEVTQKQFEDLLGVNPSKYKDSSSWPVHNISYNDAVYYCNERSKAVGLDTMATWTAKSGTIGTDLTFTDLKIDTLSYGYRIVGHEEFEYALRAGTTTDWFWGEKLSDIGDYAVWSGNANKKVFTAKPVSVASKLPNAWGLYDMIGNVNEVTLNPKFNYSKGGFTRGNSYMDQLNTGFMAATTNGLSGQDIETGFRCALRTSN